MAQYILTDSRERVLHSKRAGKPIFFYSSERLALVAAGIFSKRHRKPILVWEWEDFNKVPGVDFLEQVKLDTE